MNFSRGVETKGYKVGFELGFLFSFTLFFSMLYFVFIKNTGWFNSYIEYLIRVFLILAILICIKKLTKKEKMAG